MVIFAVLASLTGTASLQPPPRPGIAAEQARATVRIIAGARISADAKPEEATLRDAHIKASDGLEQTVRIVEFP